MSSQEHAATPGAVTDINNIMAKIMYQADFLCVHPSDAEISPNPEWKRTLARGLAVDEAGSSTLIEQAQTTLDMATQPWPTPSPPKITVAMQNHRRMVCHQLEAQLIPPEDQDQERFLSEFFVSAPDAEEQAAMERTCAYFGKDPDYRPRHVFYVSTQEDNDDYIRILIRKGLRSGRISDHDLRQFVTERMCMVPFFFTILGPDGSDPGPSARHIMAQVTTSGLVDFTELKSDKSVDGAVEAEVAEPYLEVPNSHNTNCSPYQAQKEVGQSPVSGVLSKEKPDEGDDDRSPVSGEPSEENGGEGDGHISPVGGESSDTLDEDDGHGSDDLDTQNTEPTSCGSETGESDYDAYGRMTLALCKAAVEQSNLVNQRAQKQLQHTLLEISQCDKMSNLKSLAKQMREMEDQMD
ncbi:hypothetical protein FACUT_6492 [Fusarium acutatum]|uniref:Uncharacterized protein n=1 Tax=Fusarium acutatum TaxID=78861 RepID=A0A8H4JT45_9HYPO|nr:hypothetical protein FACUT_6492 [Fusarium acutatum]